MSFDVALHDFIQPFTKLAQANMDLWSRFAFSSDVQAEVIRSAQALVEQAQMSAVHLAQSQAFSGLVQGLMKNNVQFVSELSQSACSMMGQGQMALLPYAR